MLVVPLQPAAAAIQVVSSGTLDCGFEQVTFGAPQVNSSGYTAWIAYIYIWDADAQQWALANRGFATYAYQSGSPWWSFDFSGSLDSQTQAVGLVSSGKYVTVVNEVYDYDTQQWSDVWVGTWCQV